MRQLLFDPEQRITRQPGLLDCAAGPDVQIPVGAPRLPARDSQLWRPQPGLFHFFLVDYAAIKGGDMTRQSNQPDRLDRVERLLEQISERQDRTDQQLSHLVEFTDRLIGRNAEQIGQLANDMNFLRTVVQGHISQSTPPAHSGD